MPTPFNYNVAKCSCKDFEPTGGVLEHSIGYWGQLADHLIGLTTPPVRCVYKLKEIHQAGENIKWLTEQT